jgi:hypothetical protein
MTVLCRGCKYLHREERYSFVYVCEHTLHQEVIIDTPVDGPQYRAITCENANKRRNCSLKEEGSRTKRRITEMIERIKHAFIQKEACSN